MTEERLKVPPPCREGDKVAIIAPAGPFPPDLLHEGCELLRRWGLEPFYAPAILERWGYLAGPDLTRAGTLCDAFDDPDVRAVMCARGGYGVARILDELPWDELAEQPKRFLGFSDMTLLHLGFAARCDFVTFHAPMVASRLLHEGTPDSISRLRQALFGEDLTTIFPPIKGRCLQPGQATGRLLGGNLALMCTSLGTPWQPDFKGAILVLEDVGEPPYRTDRMMQHLRMAGALDQIAGLVLGDFGIFKDQYTLYKPDEFWGERLMLPSDLPIMYDAPFGHIYDNATLPLGAHVSLNASEGTLSIA